MSEFETQKRRTFLQVLFKAARLANDAALTRLRERTGHEWLRPAHSNLFPHIPFEGIRLTELAERLGVTKQAVQVLVDDFTGAGMLERVPDPNDGRAKLIRWTDRGREAMVDGVGFLGEFAGEFGITPEEMEQARKTLLAIVDELEGSAGDS